MSTRPMHHRWTVAAVTAAALTLLGACGGGEADTQAQGSVALAAAHPPVTITSQGENVVSAWNQIAFDTTAVPSSPAGATPEERIAGPDLATVQLAVYDAVIAIAGTHRPYAVTPTSPVAGASMEAAAIEAAYQTLKGLFPSRGAVYEGAYTTSMAGIADAGAKVLGRAVGAEVAVRMLALRANDGRETVLAPYVAGTLPGQFRGANPINRASPYIKPFGTMSHAQFRPGPPPALDSDAYAADVNEVKQIAAVNSTSRTAMQTEVARFFTEPPGSWQLRNRRQFAMASQSLADNARLTALLELSYQDAISACFDAKYTYNAWRPVSAIRLADTDGNAATAAEIDWLPHVNTPNHPEYPAAHGCGAGSVAEAIRSFYGTKQVRFSYDSTVTGTTHAYQDTDDMVRDASNGRVWGGMHFRNSTDVGAALGKDVAKWVVKHHFLPLQ
jgi:hypothetical protein